MSLRLFDVSYRVVDGPRRVHHLEVQAVERPTQKTAKRLISQSKGLPQKEIEISKIVERRTE